MKRFLAAVMVASMAVSGCANTMAVAPGPNPEQVYLVKTHTFLFLTQSSIALCKNTGAALSGCHPVPVE